jgi:DNA-binding XRE family transcriptional regulator
VEATSVLEYLILIKQKEVCFMSSSIQMFIVALIVYGAIITTFMYLFILIIRALKKYIASTDMRNEKSETRKSLGEVIKKYRTEKKMTQEFVAEILGVSRQAVSKWESGAADPSTSNLVALAKLFEIEPEDLLREVQN